MPREHFPATTYLEKKARELCYSVIQNERVGFLCWYCDANLIEEGAEQVFVGINPGGGAKDNLLDLQEGNLEKPYTISGWNIWLDGEQHDYQKAVCQLFEAMHGSDWSQKLRFTACYNVFPFRSYNWKNLVCNYDLWGPLAGWFASVLIQIRPKRIICSGNADLKQSQSTRRPNMGPWAAIQKQFETRRIFASVPLWSNYTIKGCRIKQGRLAGTKVLGFPNLGRAKMGLPILVKETRKLVKAGLWTCD